MFLKLMSDENLSDQNPAKQYQRCRECLMCFSKA